MLQNSVFEGKKTNLTDSSYAAADMLIRQSRNTLSTETPVEAGILTEVNAPGTYTAFGKLITSQIGARFVQLGYNVSTLSYQGMAGAENTVMQTAPQGQTYSAMPAKPPAKIIISGAYALGRKDVFINLHLIEVDTGRILAAYDYSLPLSSDIKELSKTAPEKEGGIFSF